MVSIRELCPSLKKIAREELNEVPSRISSDIQALRDWLKKQPHLQSVNPSDQWLIGFLRANTFSLERSKERLDMYYTLRTLLPELYHTRDPFDSTIQEILQMGYLLPITITKADDSCRVYIIRFNSTIGKYDLLDVFKVCLMIHEIMILEDDNIMVAGVDILVDLEGAGTEFFFQWTPPTAKKCITCLEKAYTLRLKGCHILYTPPGFKPAFSLMKVFLNEKIKQRFFVYPAINESIYNKISKSILPTEYGGENGNVKELIDHWKAKVESYRDWFLLQEKQCSDETLRPDEPRSLSSLFGVEGSFRNLEVD